MDEQKTFLTKGTGNARQGSNKPPSFRGGAVSMGPETSYLYFKQKKN